MSRVPNRIRVASATLALLVVAAGAASAQTEVLTVQGTLPRLNYRDTNANLIWSMPANTVLWKLDGPINAGVMIVTAAAASRPRSSRSAISTFPRTPARCWSIPATRTRTRRSTR